MRVRAHKENLGSAGRMSVCLAGVLLAWCLAAGVAAAGQVLSQYRHATAIGPEYDQMFPYYMKYCSTTKYHPFKGRGIEGTMAGHGLYYLKGVCQDAARGPAGIKLCEEDADFTDPDLGVGLSVDKGLKNVNFLVIPGQRLFLGRNLIGQRPLDMEAKDAVVEEVLATGAFEGVEFHADMLPASLAPEDRREFIARYVFGSDYALAMARNLYCINIPMNRASMGLVVDELNALNAQHAQSAGQPYRGLLGPDTKKDNAYYWNGLFDNCVHPGWNVLAKLGLLRHKTVNKPFWQQIWNMAIPANTLLSVHKQANRAELDPEAYFRDPAKRQAFQRWAWVGSQAGTMVEIIRLHSPNLLYKKTHAMFILPSMFEFRYSDFQEACNNPAYGYQGGGWQGYKANFELFRAKLAKAQSQVLASQAGHRYLQAKKKLAAAAIGDGQAEESKGHAQGLAAAKEYVEFIDQFAAYLRSEQQRLEVLHQQVVQATAL